MTWKVMTASAHVSGKARQYGRYRRVAVVSVVHGCEPAMISERAKGVFRPLGAPSAIIDLGSHSVGKTAKCAYQQALRRAEDICRQLNNAQPTALPTELWSWGGSA